MVRRQNFKVDEAALLRTYRISTLSPTTWEDIDHELTDSVAGALSDSTKSKADPEHDPLGLGGSVDLSSIDMESKAAILISSKSFDPKAFLAAVHPNATYHDLASGISHLRRSIESRAEAIRVLVEENFDRFVAVKACTEALYAEMHDGLLADDTEFATKTLREQLKLCAAKADQVFLPVLENASKAHTLQATLAVFERSKFFFNLPGSLMSAIEAGKYDLALRDYRKGKYLFESRPGQLLPMETANAVTSTASAQLAKSTDSMSTSSSLAETQQKRILDKVWSTVEKVMSEMKNVLLEQLKEENRSVDELEKTIEILLELNTTDDPVWVYFDNQHKHILELLNKAYESSILQVEKIKTETLRLNDPTALNALLVKQLQAGVQSLSNKDGEVTVDDAGGQDAWEAVVELVKKMFSVLLTALPPFWKIAKGYMEGRFKRGPPGGIGSRRSPNQCRIMAAEIIRLYISHLSVFFTLTDMAVTSPPDHGTDSPPMPSFVPESSNSLITCHYLIAILAEVNDCVTETRALDISSDVASSLANLLESTRWRFEDALSAVWIRDANMFFNLETWISNPAEPTSTLYLTLLQTFQNHVTSAALKIAGGTEPTSAAPSSSRQGKQNRIPMEFAAKITKSFLDALYAFLDGMVHLASDDDIMNRQVLAGKAQATASSVPGHMDLLDLANPDTRLLIVISNFGYLVQQILPNMIGQLEAAFGINVEADRQTLETVIQELDRTLFEGYIKPKATAVLEIVRQGILDPEMDWYETPRPTEIRPYMYETLMYLVRVHSHVSKVAKPLLDRTLNALVEQIAEEALRCFRQVKRFGMGGMLRATLEIEFMHQTLSRYVTAAAAKILSVLYNKISQAYQRRPGDESLQNHLDNVKQTLAETRRATAIEFMCFKGNSRSKDTEKTGVARAPRSATPSTRDGHESSESGRTARSRNRSINPPLPASRVASQYSYKGD